MLMDEAGAAHRLWAVIESERVRLGWTAVQMAQHIDLPRSTIDRLRKGSRPPQVGTVHAVADALGIDRIDAARLAGLRPQEDWEWEIWSLDHLDLVERQKMIDGARQLRAERQATRREAI